MTALKKCEWCSQNTRSPVSYKCGKKTFWLHKKCQTSMFGNVSKENIPFEDIYYALEKKGSCDGIGASQYRRIKRMWISRGRPLKDLRTFIYENANEPP